MKLSSSRVTVALAILALVVTACGSNGGATTATTTAGGPTPSPAAGQPTRVPEPTATNTPIPIIRGYSSLGAEYDYSKHPLAGAKYGGTFTTFIERGPGSCTIGFRPNNGRVANNTCNGMFNQLIRTGPGDMILPDLAQSWDLSKDGTVWTFNLRQGVEFHDGSDFTADAVVYNLGRLINPPKGTVPGTGFGETGASKVEAVDNYTVKITLTTPYADFLYDFAVPTNVGGIGCPKAYEKLIAAGKVPLFIEFTTSCGTGAFKPLRYVEESSYELVKNPDYWGKGLPYLDGMKVLVIPDQSTRIATMITGRADMYQATELPYPDRAAIEKSGPFKQGKIITYEYQTGLKQTLFINTQAPLMQDKRVREAILLAVNVNEAHRVIGYNQGAWEGLIMPKASGWALPDEEMKAYPGQGPDPDGDLVKAKQLLTAAGFPNGFAARPIQQRVTDKAVANMNFIVTRLNLIGIKIEGRPVDASAATIYQDNHNYEVDGGYDGGTFTPGGPGMLDSFLCTGRPTCNRAMYNNPEYEKLFDVQRKTLDRVERKKIADQMQRMILKEYIYTVTQWGVRNVAWQSYVKNYDPTSQTQSVTHSNRYEMVWFDR